MKKAIVCLSVVTGIFLPPMQGNAFPFTSYHLPFHHTTPVSKVTNFTYKIEKKHIELSWVVEANQDSNFFEIEKSNDGKSYTTAALVFCTDKADKDYYSFYESKKLATNYYRIKILHKDNSVTYSDAIVTKAG